MRKYVVFGIIFIICCVSIICAFAFSNLTENQKTPRQIQIIPADANLAQNWFDEYITQLQEPAELQLPLKEQWKFKAPTGMNAGSMRAAVSQKYVFISYSQIDPNADLKKIREQQKEGKNVKLPMKHFVECYDVGTGNKLWINPYISGRMAVIPGYLLVLFSGSNGLSIAVLDYKQGNIIKTFLYKVDSTLKYTLKDVPENSTFTEIWASGTRKDMLGSLYSGKSPVHLNINKWTDEDAKLILDIFSFGGDVDYIMKHGAIKGQFFFPNANNAVIIETKRKILYKSIFDDKIYWKQICTAGTRNTLLWKPPYIGIFSSTRSVTAYSIENGKPEWIYEFPALNPSGGPTYKFASLKDGILLITEPLTGINEKSKNLWAIKLDPSGKELFKQELTMKSLYQNLAILNSFLVLWTESELICYGHTDNLPELNQVKEKTTLSEEQRIQEIERLHKEYNETLSSYERRFICQKLGKLNDKTMIERLINDFESAKANESSDYVESFGFLNDRRAMNILIPLLKDDSFSVREKAKVSLQRLTGMGSIELTAAEDWQNWWIDHQHLYIN
jgi:hypothetical protein